MSDVVNTTNKLVEDRYYIFKHTNRWELVSINGIGYDEFERPKYYESERVAISLGITIRDTESSICFHAGIFMDDLMGIDGPSWYSNFKEFITNNLELAYRTPTDSVWDDDRFLSADEVQRITLELLA